MTTVEPDQTGRRSAVPVAPAPAVSRIVVFTTSYPRGEGDFSGGFVHDAVELTRARGIDVDVVSPGVFRDWGLGRPGGMARNVRRRPWALPAMLLSALRTLRRTARDADLVHTHWLLSALVVRMCGRPWVVTLHGTGSAGPRFEDLALVERHPRLVRWLLNPSSGVICVSERLADAMTSIGVQNVSWIPNGVEIPEDTGTPVSPPHVLYAGRLSPEKAIDVLAAATEGLPRVIVGDGPERHELPEALGMMPRERMADFYRDATVVTLPSYREGLPLVVIEALAHARPVVATPVGGIPSLIQHGETGLLVEPGDAEGLRSAIMSLLDDPDRSREMGALGRERIAGMCGWDVVIPRLISTYERAALSAWTPASTGTVAGGMVLLTIGNMLFTVLGYVLVLALARILSTADYGRYQLAAGVISILATLLLKGIPVGAVRTIANAAASPRLVSRRLAVMLTWSAAALMVIFAVASLPFMVLLDDPRGAFVILLASMAAATFAVNGYFTSMAQAMGRFGRLAGAQAMYGFAKTVLVIGGALIHGVSGAIAGFAIAPIAGVLPVLFSARMPTSGPWPDRSRRWVDSAIRRLAGPMIVSSFAVTTMLIIDVVVVRVLSSAHQTGLYAVAAVIGHVPYFLLQSSAIAVLPAIAAVAGTPALRETVRRCMSDIASLLALPTVGIAMLGDRALPLIVGPGYETPHILVAPIAIATAGITLYAALVAIDAGLDRVRGAVLIGVAGVLIFTTSVAIGTWVDGISGTAWAAAASGVAVAVAHTAWLTWQHGSILAPRIALAWVFAVVVTVPLLLLPQSLLALMAGAAAAAVVWIVAVQRFKVLDLRRRPGASDHVADSAVAPG